MKWLRSNFSAYPVAYVLLAFGLVNLVFASVWWPGKADFTRLVALILIGGTVGFLVWRWDQDRPSN